MRIQVKQRFNFDNIFSGFSGIINQQWSINSKRSLNAQPMIIVKLKPIFSIEKYLGI